MAKFSIGEIVVIVRATQAPELVGEEVEIIGLPGSVKKWPDCYVLDCKRFARKFKTDPFGEGAATAPEYCLRKKRPPQQDEEWDEGYLKWRDETFPEKVVA